VFPTDVPEQPTLTRAEFVEFLAAQFGLGPAAARSTARLFAGIEEVRGARCGNVI
jgi:hypothetical protein